MVVKLVLLGDGAVGKTSLRLRYMGLGFQSSYLETIGSDFAFKEVDYNGEMVKIQIWDIAGQPTYSSVRKHYYFGAHAIILVFDVTRPESFESLESWVHEVKNNIEHKVPIILIANKIDLRTEFHNYLTEELGLKARERLEIINQAPVSYMETSAKTGENVERAFQTLIDQVHTMFPDDE